MTTTEDRHQPAAVMATGPRGLGGNCWLRHPQTGVHCCREVDHEKRGAGHLHPYTGTRWK